MKATRFYCDALCIISQINNISTGHLLRKLICAAHEKRKKKCKIRKNLVLHGRLKKSANDPSGPDPVSVAWSGSPGWDTSPSQGYPQVLNSLVPIYSIHLGGERDCECMKCLVQEHGTISPARARTLLERAKQNTFNSQWLNFQPGE